MMSMIFETTTLQLFELPCKCNTLPFLHLGIGKTLKLANASILKTLHYSTHIDFTFYPVAGILGKPKLPGTVIENALTGRPVYYAKEVRSDTGE